MLLLEAFVRIAIDVVAVGGMMSEVKLQSSEVNVSSELDDFMQYLWADEIPVVCRK